MQTLVPVGKNIGYGLGIVGQQLSCSKMEVWWHNGGTIGYGTWAGTTQDGSISLVLSLSTTSFSGSDTTYGRTTAQLEDNLIRHVFCGPQSNANDNIMQQPAIESKSPIS